MSTWTDEKHTVAGGRMCPKHTAERAQWVEYCGPLGKQYDTHSEYIVLNQDPVELQSLAAQRRRRLVINQVRLIERICATRKSCTVEASQGNP